jgi:sulfonate transport system substrate-binding protein
MLRSVAVCCLVCAGCLKFETRAQTLAPLRAAGNLSTIELSPLLVAADKIYPGISVINGGIPTIMNGMVDVATNAETQLLRQSIEDPSLRAIFTVAESFYRIVARKSAGIHRIEDLKGKRITTPRNTSAHYFLVKMLATAHLAETDITLVTIDPSTEMSTELKDGRVDAVSMWEPESERAIAAVGSDAIVFQDRHVYRELFNLNTSAKVLADSAKRRAIVELLRSLIAASE